MEYLELLLAFVPVGLFLMALQLEGVKTVKGIKKFLQCFSAIGTFLLCIMIPLLLCAESMCWENPSEKFDLYYQILRGFMIVLAITTFIASSFAYLYPGYRKAH